jgi:hypothetical protein
MWQWTGVRAGDGSRSADGRTVADVGSRMPSIALFAFDVPCMAGVAMSDEEAWSRDRRELSKRRWSLQNVRGWLTRGLSCYSMAL